MDVSLKIEKAIQRVQNSGDESTLIDELLCGALNWPITDEDDETIEIEDISYSWNDVLEEMGFESGDAPVDLRQIRPFPGWPHGIFIVRFGTEKFFTQGRGLTLPLRKILRNLMQKIRPTATHPSWKREHLLFLCHNQTEYFQFAHFKASQEDSKAPQLRMFGWGPNDRIRTVCEYNLPNLVYREGISEDDATTSLEAAFDVSRVSKKFYEDYKNAFENAKPFIEKYSTITDDSDLHRATQILFNRLLFLRFIEKKGWFHFGETEDYLRELYKAKGLGSDSFFTSRLRRLFFEGLAIEGKQEDSAYGNVAFLNGGLFEETKFDEAITDLPDEMFEPLLGSDGLFYNYNFTVQESTPLDIDVAIDPEMIGTMFEELVTGRNKKGAFYTPRVVVSYMCRESLKSVLEERTEVDSEAIRKLVDDDDNEGLSIDDARVINSVLAELKAIDLACGSGAYLLGLLHELVRIHTKLSTTDEELSESRHEMKLRIISRSIYGVDIDPFATNIAMLRLWLSLSVEAPEPLPLPNLDFNIETGDSLLAPDPSAYVFDVTGAIEKADALAIKKETYLSATGLGARQLRDDIRAEEANIRKLLRKQNDEIGSVDFRVHFASVFTKNGGFDIVLANPPYVRQEEIEKKSKVKMLTLYGAGNNPPVQGKSDLYCYFFVRANQLLRRGGIQIFICSNTWLDVGFGMPLQHYFLRTTQIDRILDSAVERQFQSADVNTVISFIRKKSVPEDHEVNFIFLQGSFDSASRNSEQQKVREVNQQKLRNSGTNSREKYEGTKWSNHLRAPNIYWKIIEHSAKLVKLEEVIDSISRGIRTGNDKFFYLKQSIVDEYRISSQYLLPLLKSSANNQNTIPSIENQEHYVFNCRDPKESIRCNGAKKYIDDAEKLGYHNKKEYQGKQLWYSLRISKPFPIILPISVNDVPRIYFNKNELVIHQRLYGINCSEKIVGKLHSLLTSTYFAFIMEVNGRTGLGQGLLELTGRDYSKLLVPKLELIDNPCQIIRDIESLESELLKEDRLKLDAVVFDALGLTQDERKQLYEAYIALVTNRIGKSTTITSPIN